MDRRSLDRRQFIERYGGIYERSPWVADEAFDLAGDIDDPDDLAAVLARCVDAAPRKRKFELICAHPDLAGRAAVAGELTPESTAEQASAGIDRCTADEYRRFQELNERYRSKFGFPFVMAVRDSSRHEILAAFERRLGHDVETEFDTAIREIHRIARLRLQAMFDE